MVFFTIYRLLVVKKKTKMDNTAMILQLIQNMKPLFGTENTVVIVEYVDLRHHFITPHVRQMAASQIKKKS